VFLPKENKCHATDIQFSLEIYMAQWGRNGRVSALRAGGPRFKQRG